MGKQYGFYIDTDRCVQCHACEVACKSWNAVEPKIRWRRVLDVWGGEFPEVTNRTISYSCMHCEKPECAAVCPGAAIRKRSEDGLVAVDRARCIGCRSCAQACPFRIPQFDLAGLMQKCDGCLERLGQGKQPACAATCPGEALKFGVVEDLAKMAAAKAGERLAHSAGPAFFISGRMTGSIFLDLIKKQGPGPENSVFES